MAYAFGASGFKLGERVEILDRKVKGILISEIIHLTGCNTYQVYCPLLLDEKGSPRILNIDHLKLRRLGEDESLLDNTTKLNDENSFCPKGMDVNAEYIDAAIAVPKEPISELDEAIGVEEIVFKPGLEIWHKIYMQKMTVTWVTRYVYGKTLEYGCVSYDEKGKEFAVNDVAYALIPLQQLIDVYPDEQGKVGCGEVFLDSGFIPEM